MFQEISELKYVKFVKRDAIEKEALLSKPKFSDMSLIPLLYDEFRRIVADDKSQSKQSGRLKKQFVFIILYLYSPATLAGGKIRTGVRNELQKLFRYKSPTAISNIGASAAFWYSQYRHFRKQVESVFIRLMEWHNERIKTDS